MADPPFTYRDEQMLVALVTMATTSNHSARREARLKRQAVTDDLTGLWHHGYFRELFENAVETRVGETMGVLFADVDRFKQVNDEIGHLEADDVLREIGHRMRVTLPEDAIVARMGGDEFAALVRHLDDADHLERIVADLQAAVGRPDAGGRPHAERRRQRRQRALGVRRRRPRGPAPRGRARHAAPQALAAATARRCAGTTSARRCAR